MPRMLPSASASGPLIALRSVSKVASKWKSRKILLQDVNWVIGPRERIVVLGRPQSGAPALIDIIGGQASPTSGWVDRRATLSAPRGLLPYAGLDTPRQLILRLSRLYRMDPMEVTDFVSNGSGRDDILDIPSRKLPPRFRQQLNVVLTLAFPFDYYLFHAPPVAIGDQRFQTFCENALELRSRESGLIVRTISSRGARRMSGEMMGALVYQGNLTLYRHLTDAIAVFDSLPPEVNDPMDAEQEDVVAAEEDAIDML